MWSGAEVGLFDRLRRSAGVPADLLERELLLLAPDSDEEAVGTQTLTEDRTFSVVSVTDCEGRKVLPAFTTEAALLRWRPEGSRYIGSPGKTVVEILARGDWDRMVVDTGSPTAFAMTPVEAAELLRSARSYPSFRDAREYWRYDEGPLLDAYVCSTTVEDWQLAIDAVLSLGWATSYLEDGKPEAMPSVSEIFARSELVVAAWSIHPVNDMRINCHFFVADEIEFDFCPRELVSQRHLDLVCDFISVLGRGIRKPVAVGIESSNPRPPPLMRYDPLTDRIVLEEF